MPSKSLSNVLFDHYRPPSYLGPRQLSPWKLLNFIVIPAICSAVLLVSCGSIARDQIVVFVSVFALVAAIFAGLLGVTQSLLATVVVPNPDASDAVALIKKARIRVRVLRDLFTTTSYAIILTVFALVPLLCMVALKENSVMYRACSGVVYFAATTIGVSVIQILHDLYNILEHVVGELEKKLNVSFDTGGDSEEDAGTNV